MEFVWDIGKKLAFGGAVLVAVPVLVPCLFVLSITAAALSVPVASTAVGYYAVKKVLGFGKTRVLGWHSDTNRDEDLDMKHEARRAEVEGSMPPSSPECEIVPVSQEPTTEHQLDEGYDDQDMVEGSPRVGVCAPVPVSAPPHPEDAEWERIGAEGAPEVRQEEKAGAEIVQMNVCEQSQSNASVGTQNVEGSEYQQDELVEADKEQRVPPSDGGVELQEPASQDTIEIEQQKPVGHAEGDKSKQMDLQPQTSSAAEYRGQENGREPDEVDKVEFESIEEEGMHDFEKVDKPLPEPHDAGKKRLASEVTSLTSQGEEKVPREENMHMHPEELKQSESLAPEAEEKESGAQQVKSEAEEKELGAEQVKPEVEEKEPGGEQLKPGAEQLDFEGGGNRREQETSGYHRLDGASSIDEYEPEAEEKPLAEPGAEELKPLLAPEAAEPEAEADGGAPDHRHGDEKGNDQRLEREANHIHDDDSEPKLERTEDSEQKLVDMEADMEKTEHGVHDGDSEQAVIMEPEEDHHHDGREPVVMELQAPKPAVVESEGGGGNRSEQDTSRLDGASSMDEYASVAEEFPEDGVSSSDELGSRRFHSQELSRTSSGRSEDYLLREILTVQKVVGYEDDLRESPADEVERLYDFLGVEMPPAYENTTDPRKLLESLDLLKAIVGVK